MEHPQTLGLGVRTAMLMQDTVPALFTSCDLLENYSLIFRQREMLSLPRFGHLPARKMAAGKSAPPSRTLLDFLLRDRHRLLEFS